MRYPGLWAYAPRPWEVAVEYVKHAWAEIWRWFVFTFAATVPMPIIVLVFIQKAKHQDVGLASLGGRGDFFLMALALTAAATGAAIPPKEHRGDGVVGFTVLGGVLSALAAGGWAATTASLGTKKPFDPGVVAAWGGTALLTAIAYTLVALGIAAYLRPKHG